MLTLVVLAIIFGGGAAAVAASPKLQQLLRIRAGGAIDKATTEIEKQQDKYDQLLAKLPKQREAVASVMGKAAEAKTRCERLRKQQSEVAANYQTAKAAKDAGKPVSDALIKTLGEQFVDLKDQITKADAALTETQTMATDARNTLDATDKALHSFKDKIQDNKAKAELTKALSLNADAMQSAHEILNEVQGAGGSSVIDEELEKQRAKSQLSKGTQTDQELADLQNSTKADRGIAELDALFSGAPAAPATNELDALVSGKPEEKKA